MQAKRGGFASEDDSVHGRVLRCLEERFPDIEVLDRDISVGGGRRADLVAVDASGRLLLVLLVEGEGDELLLRALDALAFARRNLPILGSHLRSARVRAQIPPRVLLIAESFSERLIERTAGLDAEGFACLELRTLESDRGEATYLVPLPTRRGSEAAQRRAPAEGRGFLESLPSPRRAIGELLMRRIARIDEELSCASDESSATWRLGGELLCCLVAVGDAIEGQVPPAARPRRIRTTEAAEGFVEEVLGRYMELLGRGSGGGSSSGSRPAGSPHSGGSDPEAPVLTPEELEAFRG